MPNALAHFAAQVPLARRGLGLCDPRWLYLGCLLPDVPWLLQRALRALPLPLVDPIELRLYAMAQASLAGTLLLCAALALLSTRPRRVLALLSGNAALHLLLDACEVKWGNGVHLLAPFSWRMTALELFDNDGLLNLGLTGAGFALVVWELWRRRPLAAQAAARPQRLAAAAVLAAVYLLAPLPFRTALLASDSYGVRTLSQREQRPGRPIQLDRARLVPGSGGSRLSLWTGEQLRLSEPLPARTRRVSLAGRFEAPGLLRVERYAIHRFDRDPPSWVGLGALALLWLRPLLARRRGGSGGARHAAAQRPPSATSTRA